MKTTRHENKTTNKIKIKMIFISSAVALVIFGALGCQNPGEAGSPSEGLEAATIASVYPVNVTAIGAIGEEQVSTDANMASPSSAIKLSVDNLGAGREVSFTASGVDFQTTSVTDDGTVIFEMPAQPVEITATFATVQADAVVKEESSVDDDTNDDVIAEDVADDGTADDVVVEDVADDGTADDAAIDNGEEVVIVDNVIPVTDSKAIAKAQKKAELKAARLAGQKAKREARLQERQLAKAKRRAERLAERQAKRQAQKEAKKEARKIARAEKQAKLKAEKEAKAKGKK